MFRTLFIILSCSLPAGLELSNNIILHFRFDNEVLKISDQLKEEHTIRDKIQRERDGLVAERFSFDQQLKNMQMENEVATDKVKRLDAELVELTSVSKEDQEVSAIITKIYMVRVLNCTFYAKITCFDLQWNKYRL